MRRMPHSPRLHHALPYLGMLVGICILASPLIADLVDGWRASQTISQATVAVEHISEELRSGLLEQARAYNDQLATHEAREGLLPYGQQLSYEGSDVMCWVEIPRIKVRLGVYHGTGIDELAAGAGHLEGTSLPVGGTSSHCAISAHSGMPTARLFDDIHDLVAGDLFVLWTLDEPYAYRVTGSETVEPDDVSSLRIEPGRDLCTLITCTPYGINSQRLLVHAERCAYDEADAEPSPPLYLSPHTWPPVAGLIAAGGTIALLSWRTLAQRDQQGDES